MGGFGFEGVGADEFAEVGGLVRGRHLHRAHLVEIDGDAAAGEDEGGFRAGKSGAEDGEEGTIVRFAR